MLQTPVVAFTASHLNAKRLTVSFQKLLCLFLFSLQMHPVPSARHGALHKKVRTGFKSYKLAKACLLLSYNLFSLSLTLSAYTVSRFGFRHTEHLLPCPPFKWIKGISEPFRLRKYRIPCQPDMRPFLSLTLWTSHELVWPSPSPKNSCTCWIFCTTFTIKLCETVLLVSGYLDNSTGLNACLSVKLKEACQYLATIFMPL